jgi:hypothetical protein
MVSFVFSRHNIHFVYTIPVLDTIVVPTRDLHHIRPLRLVQGSPINQCDRRIIFPPGAVPQKTTEEVAFGVKRNLDEEIRTTYQDNVSGMPTTFKVKNPPDTSCARLGEDVAHYAYCASLWHRTFWGMPTKEATEYAVKHMPTAYGPIQWVHIFDISRN